MPRKNKSKVNAAQAKSSQAEAKAFQAEIQAARREAERNRKKFIRETDRQLKATVKRIKGMGIYEPKSLEMTPYRRKRIRRIEREYAEILDERKYFLIPVPKADQKRVRQRAESLKLEHTRTGLIIPREGHASVKLKKNRQGEIFVERRGKTKKGVNKDRKYRSVTPLASLDEIDKERERIRRAVKRLGSVTGRDRIHFVVLEDGTEGVGRRHFDTYEDLMEYLDGYKMNEAKRINFYRHVHVIKTTVEDFKKRYPPKDRGKPARVKPGKHDTRRSK